MSGAPWFGGGKPRPPGYDPYKDLSNGTGGGFKSIYENSQPYVNPETGSDNFKWFGGERRKKTEQEIELETRAKKNTLSINRQKEYQNWEIGEARRQQEEEAAAVREYMENLQRAYDKQRKEMARRAEAQRIAAENQMAAAKAKGNKSARPETGAYEGEPSERRGGGDDGGASGTLLTRAADKPTLGKRGRLGSKTLLGG